MALAVASSHAGSSPHTRGAPVRVNGADNVRRIIPAYAGSTSSRSALTFPHRDHPRIRGEHDIAVMVIAGGDGSSPHTRGAHRTCRAETIGPGIIPAYAGSTVKQALNTVYGKGSSPHTRGARLKFVAYFYALGIIPAYAGSTDCCRLEAAPTADHPRIRGEHSWAIFESYGQFGSSPHTRGARPPEGHVPRHGRIIPAYAGSTPGKPSPARIPPDHPRIRGEHSQRHDPKGDFTGSSPHTRGALARAGLASSRVGIIPAYAGSTRICSALAATFADHPRIRGEHPASTMSACRGAGSSPHTRGAPEPSSTKSPSWRIIPAYAGSTVMMSSHWASDLDHPRIRGEHRRAAPAEGELHGSSPHTRGARRPGVGGRENGGIIPAYAGSTACSPPAGSSRRDHPRIRGEHGALDRMLAPVDGSSPHTRGAHWPAPHLWTIDRIIPAYAGSTPTACYRG